MSLNLKSIERVLTKCFLWSGNMLNILCNTALSFGSSNVINDFHKNYKALRLGFGTERNVNKPHVVVAVLLVLIV